MKTLNDTTAYPTIVSNSDVASGGDCVITIAANAVQYHTIDHISGGYHVAPDANSHLVVTDTTANAVVWKVPVTAAGPFIFPFGVRGMQTPLGAGLTITLEDGSQLKDLSVQYR